MDFRLISATNIDVSEAVSKNQFREDFFYRISTIVIKVPSLRERKEDLVDLIDYVMAESQKEHQITIRHIEPHVMEFLLDYHYPGNIRELKTLLTVWWSCLMTVLFLMMASDYAFHQLIFKTS